MRLFRDPTVPAHPLLTTPDAGTTQARGAGVCVRACGRVTGGAASTPSGGMEPVNPQLIDALSTRGHAIQQAVSDLLGADGAPLGSVTPVWGFHLDATADTTVVFLCGPGGFYRAEATADGRQLLVQIPARRISQVVEQRSGDSITVTVEVDADSRLEQSVGQAISGAALDDGLVVEGTQMTRTEARSVITPTSYTMVAARADQVPLLRLGRAVRALIS
jgi:hypothetical protein